MSQPPDDVTAPPRLARVATRAIAWAGTLALVAGCSVELRPGSNDDEARDSAGATASADTASATAPDDSLRAVGGDEVRDSARVATVVDTSAGLVADTGGTSPVATPAELAALTAAGLAVPVAGVSAAELPDNFHEMRGSRPHDALDILAPRGTPVLSATDGRLLALHDSERGGLMVYASDASDRFVLLYGHLDAYAPGLVEGMSLRRGQPLGTVGTSGNAAPGTPHLHFGIARVRDTREWWKGSAVDPRPLLVRSAGAR